MSNVKHGTVEKGYNRWRNAVNRLFYNKNPKERFLILSVFVIHFFLAAVFSKITLPYTDMALCVPLVDALLCASGGGALGVFSGAIYGALLTKTASFSRCFILIAVTVLRVAVCVWSGSDKGVRLFRETPLVKVGYAAFMALAQCAFYLTDAGAIGDVWKRLFTTAVVLPVLTAVFSFFFSGCPQKRISGGGGVVRALYEISLLAFFFSVVYSLRDVRYFGVSLASVSALILTLVVASKGGGVRGAFIGGVLGATVNPALAASYATVGGVGGIFYCLGVLPAAGISAFAGIAVSLLQVGYAAFIGFIPETVIAVAIVSPLIKYSFIPEYFPYPKNEQPREYAALNDAETRAIQGIQRNEDIIRLSEALRDISKTLTGGGVGGAYEKTKAICTSLVSGFCEKCALCSICWETEVERAESSVKGIIEAGERGDALPRERNANYLSGYCIKFKELIEEIKLLTARYQPKRETAPLNEITASDFMAVSDMLSDMANSMRLESRRDEDAEKELLGVAGAIGFKPNTVSVIGSERKRIYAYGVKDNLSDEEREKVRKAFSEACKTEYSSPVISGEYSECMVFSPEKTLSARVHHVKITKDGEVCSGDSVVTAETEDGYFYAMLADGMGSGEEAGTVSKTAINVLDKLLRCKVKKAKAAELVGDILKRRSGECFTTLDIMELDLISGNASFLKNGAAASYVVRNGGVYCINAYSMPVGITDEARSEEIGFRLSEGDTVIMLSDGVASDVIDGKWISDTVCQGYASGEELAENILKRANKVNPQSDDKTVMIIGIERFKPEEISKGA